MQLHLHPFIRFCIVGGIGLLINLSVIYLGVDVFHLWIVPTFMVGLLISWSISFVLNAFITFPEHERSAYYTKYFLYLSNYSIVFALNTVLIYLLTTIVGLHYFIATIICALSTVFLTYSFSKYVVYKS